MVNKSENVINFYLFSNVLKNKIRTGWLNMEIKKERIESVAEHIYGCLMLAIALNSEYDLKLDMYKVLKMISLHELEEILSPDYTPRDNLTKAERDEIGRKSVKKVVESLVKGREIAMLLEEFNAHETAESKFSYLIDKIECDFQAKLYDLEGAFDIEKARADLPFYGDRADYIEKHSKCASDFWIEYDKPKFIDNAIFEDLLKEILNLTRRN